MPFKPWATGREGIYNPLESVAASALNQTYVPGAGWVNKSVAKEVAGMMTRGLSSPIEPTAAAAKMGLPATPSDAISGSGMGTTKPSPFNLADSFGAQLIGGGGIKLFSQALKELFGGKSKTEKPKTLSEVYLEAYNAAKAARVPSRYLKDALGEK